MENPRYFYTSIIQDPTAITCAIKARFTKSLKEDCDNDVDVSLISFISKMSEDSG